MSQINDNLLQIIECPVCLEYLNGKIYLCESGHSICGKCVGVLIKCPTCNLKLSKMRNYLMECIAEKLEYPCVNQRLGCSKYFSKIDMNNHVEYECFYRTYDCVIDGECDWQGHVMEIRTHYHEKHMDVISFGNTHVFTWNADEDENSLYVLSAYNEIFYLYRTLEIHFVHFVLQYIGDPINASQYSLEVELFDKKTVQRRIRVCEVCVDDTVNVYSRHDSSNSELETPAASIPFRTWASFKDETGLITYEINVRKML